LEDNIEVDLGETGFELVEWIKPAQMYPVAECSERGSELSGSVKGDEFLDSLSNYRLLKTVSTAYSF
jgi:hypothetical protein